MEAGLTLGATSSDSWLLAGVMGPRGGSGNPYRRPFFQRFSPKDFERKDMDATEILGRDHQTKMWFFEQLSLADKQPLLVIRMTLAGHRNPNPPFVFNLKTGKKMVELQEFPQRNHQPPPPYGENTVMHSLLEFVPNGSHIISFEPSQPYHILRHASDSGKLVNSLPIDSPAGAMCFSPNEKMLATLCWNGDVLIVAPDLSTIAHRLKVKGYQVFPRSIAFVGNDYLAVQSRGNKIEIFNTSDWSLAHTFQPESKVTCIAGSPAGSLLAIGFDEKNPCPGLVRVFDVKKGKIATELK